MYRIFSLTLLLVCFLAADVDAQRRGGGGRGGGGFRGGGGQFSGGSHYGGGRPAYNRSPSMSRSMPSTSYRPQAASRSPAARQPSSSRSSVARSGGTARLSGASRAATPGGRTSGLSSPPTGRSAFQTAQSYQKPSRGQLDSFLAGGKAAGREQSATANRTAGAVSSGPTTGQGGETRTYETARGGSITVGGGSRSGTTERGTSVGGAAGGIKIETAGGQTITKGKGAIGASDGQNSGFAAGSRTNVDTAGGGSALAGRSVRGVTDGTNTAVRAGGGFKATDAAGNTVGNVRGATGVSDGTNSAVRAGGVTGMQDAAGNSAVNVRGGYKDSSGYRQGGSVTAKQNEWGYTAVNARTGYGAGGTGQVASKTAVRGPYGNVVSGGRGASFVNGQFVGGKAYTAVNGNFTNWGYFGPGYYRQYPGAWFPGKWAIVGTAWATATWATAGSYCGCEGGGTYYDYEDNVAYEDGNVMYEGEPVATEEEYYDQAETIADSGEETDNEDWLPLGVFAVIAEADQEKTDKVLQLALNKEGAIRGNYQDMLTDQVTPVTGSVDKESERVALKLEGNDSLVVECGLYNLTNDEVPVLVHFDSQKREPRTLIRLKNPGQETRD